MIIGASPGDPHTDKLNDCNPYHYTNDSLILFECIIIIMLHPSSCVPPSLVLRLSPPPFFMCACVTDRRGRVWAGLITCGHWWHVHVQCPLNLNLRSIKLELIEWPASWPAGSAVPSILVPVDAEHITSVCTWSNRPRLSPSNLLHMCT